ncbi:MAG: nucleoside monophosphate kinase [Buchnera aphidicola (Meitanaphis elongallis)]
MRIILLGVPGSGKGTQAQFISQRYCLPKISTGDILRQFIKNDDSLLHKRIKNAIHNGKLISDTIVTKIVENRISKTDCNVGFVLDGFPRTITQAKIIKKNKIHIDYVFEFKIPTKIILKRTQGRRIDPISGKIYNLDDNKYFKNKDHMNLIQRNDDNKKIIKKRLEEHKKFTIPLINYFHTCTTTEKIKFYTIDGTKTILNINNEIKNILD